MLLIARHGKIGYLESFGALGPDQETRMPPDAIFRIYSMSKPITNGPPWPCSRTAGSAWMTR